MTGISSQALKPLYYENKTRYNGKEQQNKEFSDGSGLELYDLSARTYDQQTGRFIQTDPLVEDGQESLTPYHFSYNNPIRFSDPTGKEGETCCGGLQQWWDDHVEQFKDNLKVLAYNANERISSAVNQAGENFNARWEARADPIHQAMDHPFSIVGGVSGSEIKAAQSILAKEVGSEVKTTAAAISTQTAESASKVSPNVQKVLNSLNEVKAEGGTIKMNPLNPKQEINMTIQKGSEKIDLRVETHVVPKKYGGNGETPQRHLNVDLHPNKKVLPNSGHKILEE